MPDHLPKGEEFEAVERPFYDTVNDEEERLAVVLSSLELIRNGTTTFLEAGTVLTPEAAAEGAELVGIRAVLGDARVVDQSWDGSRPDAGIVRFRHYGMNQDDKQVFEGERIVLIKRRSHWGDR